jgi:Alw26I/Eco31I/Esp3I family type II restriction endonuclease
MSDSNHKYGRGKYKPHKKYIEYMEWLVDHTNYHGLQNARSDDGRINWQVSSGKTTSFYKDYLARFEWWVKKADSLQVEGTRNSNDRFSITARLIHPTKLRACRICGEERNVGYYYLNKNFAKKLNKLTKSNQFVELLSMNQVVEIFSENNFDLDILVKSFPERGISKDFSNHQLVDAFQKTIHVRSTSLSPGYMCNPPDRLDGFHDYCVFCRKKSDPGRSNENMQKYNRDRRAFEWWVGGNWKAADTLYNLAGPGKCEFCGVKVDKLSPDHIGPLSCGFKHEVIFRPLCSPCNSSRNRKMSIADYNLLAKFEKKSGICMASTQIEPFWNMSKELVKYDADTELAGTIMRSMQDYYLRLLGEIKKRGGSYFLTPLIGHEFAHYNYEFEGLDETKFTYKKIVETKKITNGSISLESRVVRIAFEELDQYLSSPEDRRKIKNLESVELELAKEKVFSELDNYISSASALKWSSALAQTNTEYREKAISSLIQEDCYQVEIEQFKLIFSLMQSYYLELAKSGISLLQDAK